MLNTFNFIGERAMDVACGAAGAPNRQTPSGEYVKPSHRSRWVKNPEFYVSGNYVSAIICMKK